MSYTKVIQNYVNAAYNYAPNYTDACGCPVIIPLCNEPCPLPCEPCEKVYIDLCPKKKYKKCKKEIKIPDGKKCIKIDLCTGPESDCQSDYYEKSCLPCEKIKINLCNDCPPYVPCPVPCDPCDLYKQSEVCGCALPGYPWIANNWIGYC